MNSVALIVAMDRNRAIGRAGGMPWHLPADLAHFKRITQGRPEAGDTGQASLAERDPAPAIIMGRRTYESIGRALPGRRNIVITGQGAWRDEGVTRADSLPDALTRAGVGRRFVIGGGEIYRLALPLADELFITDVDTAIAGADTWFPAIEPAAWEERSRTVRRADERNAFDLTFRYLIRRPQG